LPAPPKALTFAAPPTIDEPTDLDKKIGSAADNEQ
jgi:hypothetical protein